MAVDLSPEAIKARRRAAEHGRHGGFTGAELVEQAALNFGEAKRLSKVLAELPLRKQGGHRAKRLDRDGDELLRRAAVQIRLAEQVPGDTGYLYRLTVAQIDRVKSDVGKLFDRDAGALAVDTHRRIGKQRQHLQRESHGDT